VHAARLTADHGAKNKGKSRTANLGAIICDKLIDHNNGVFKHVEDKVKKSNDW
jgi:hypothetical protein